MSENENAIPVYWFNRKIQVSWLLLLTCLTFFMRLNYGELHLMEARNFITAKEMIQNGNWLIPTMNGQLRLAKPPLPTWLTALSGLAAGNIENVAALRFPAACMAVLLVFFLYALASQLTSDKLIPFLSALVLSTSLLFVVVGRQGTWDIYCHSFMAGAIWLLVKGLKIPKINYWTFLLCGVLAGLSFLSKGPVSFYVLLLPFVAAYIICYGPLDFKNNARGLLTAFLACVLVSGAWPLYIYLNEPVSLTQNVSNESSAWLNRHVKPIWFYWGFVFQSGIWAILALATFVVPYAKPRIGRFGNYRFLISWVIITFLLLSVIPEKKERYLLPVLIPLALLTAHYLRYLSVSLPEKKFARWDLGLTVFTFMLIALITFAAPGVIYFFAFRQLLISGLSLSFITILFWTFTSLIIYYFLKRKFINLYILAALVNVSIMLTFIPLYQDILYPKVNYQSLRNTRNIKEVKTLPFYALYGLPLEHVWEVGKRVDTLQVINRQVKPIPKLPAAIFSPEPLAPYFPDRNIQLKQMATFHYSREDPDKTLYLFLVSSLPESGK